MKRREPLEEAPEDRLARFRFEEWNDLPEEPTEDYRRHEAAQKGNVRSSWEQWRHVAAYMAWLRARAAGR